MLDVRLDIAPAEKTPWLIRSTGTTGLRVRWDIVRDATPAPNRGSVWVHNLSESRRQQLAGDIISPSFDVVVPGDGPFPMDGAVVEAPAVLARRFQYTYCRLQAGFGASTGQVHEGVARTVSSRLEGQTWITELPFGDGSAQRSHATVNRTFERGETVLSAVSHLVRCLGLTYGNVNPATWQRLVGGTSQTFGRAFVASGDPEEYLTQLLATYGLRWFVDQGAAWIVGGAVAVSPVVVDLGVPRRTPTIEADHILVEVSHSTAVRPGCLARVSSRLTTDVWFVQEARWFGDTHGAIYTEAQLYPVGARP